jgi:heme A synthase
MRHYKAGLAIPDLPLAYGKVLPPLSQAALDSINNARAQNWEDPLTMNQIWLAFAHRLGAIAATIAVTWLIVRLLRRYARPQMLLPACTLTLLLLTQLTLGVLTVLLKKPADIASAHVAVGALLLGTTFLIVVRSSRLYGRPAQVPAPDQPARSLGFEIVQPPEALPA